MNASWLTVLGLMLLVSTLLGVVHLRFPRVRPVLFVAYPLIGACVGVWYGRQQQFSIELTVFLSIGIAFVGFQAYRAIHRYAP